jgi:hypothetical protein
MRPLIVLGMHRSGTSLTVRLLRDLGIHMGDKLSRDAEAVYFQVINRRIYFAVGSKWSNITPIRKAMLSEQFVDDQVGKTLSTLFSNRSLNPIGDISKFFGPHMWTKLVNGEKVDWGWKDPRTSLTFPIWFRVFPHARFLHIVRNGIDVAISMHRRAQKQRKSFMKRLLQIDYSPLTLDFMYCFQLWEDHMSFILENRNIIPPENYLELRYEDLLASPAENLKLIMNFIEYPIDEDVLEKACEQINRGRLNNANYAKLYEDIIPSLASHPLMQQLDYSYSITKGVNEAVYEH